MKILYHGIKTRYAYDFPLCFPPHELIMSLRNIHLALNFFCVLCPSSPQLGPSPVLHPFVLYLLNFSSTSGLITSMFDIASLIVTAFVGYYGGQQSKARWLSSGLLFLALGSLIFISPHFIIGPYKPGNVYTDKRSVLRRLCVDTNRNIKRLLYCKKKGNIKR